MKIMETITTFEFLEDDYDYLNYIDPTILEDLHFPKTENNFEYIKKNHFQLLLKLFAEFMDDSIVIIFLSVFQNKIYFVVVEGLTFINYYDIKYGIIKNFLKQKENRNVFEYGKHNVNYFDSMCVPLLLRKSKYDLIRTLILNKYQNHSPKFAPLTRTFCGYKNNFFSITYSSFEELYYIFIRDHFDLKFKERLHINFEHTCSLEESLKKIIFYKI